MCDFFFFFVRSGDHFIFDHSNACGTYEFKLFAVSKYGYSEAKQTVVAEGMNDSLIKGLIRKFDCFFYSSKVEILSKLRDAFNGSIE